MFLQKVRIGYTVKIDKNFTNEILMSQSTPRKMSKK